MNNTLRRGARWLVLALALTLTVSVTPNVSQAQNPTYCYGGWSQNTNMDLLTLAEFLALAFEGIIAMTGF
jgi:hypothetical protein